ncbi:unnamed protein product [Adineta ricciae]|uniref:Uncharacterized protein n=1 Tax=Adineta ricciae TaxID=249248 RepID=A0A814X3K9_ADIRI|nr:unnamed protein product [Adineta ricciae]CAF1208988.1 unnamed protein product [Adineta ricciae]
MGNAIANTDVINELTERANYFVEERVAKIPAQFKSQKDHIVHEMHKASPDSYKDLYIKDYPEKNEKQVSKLAIHNVTSNEVKHQIVEEINGEVDPIIDAKTAHLNKLVRTATKKTIHIAIEKSVRIAVNKVQAQLERDVGC